MEKELVQVGFKVDKIDWYECTKKGSVSGTVSELLANDDLLKRSVFIDMSNIDHDPKIVLRTIRVPLSLARKLSQVSQTHDLSQSQLLRRLVHVIAEG